MGLLPGGMNDTGVGDKVTSISLLGVGSAEGETGEGFGVKVASGWLLCVGRLGSGTGGGFSVEGHDSYDPSGLSRTRSTSVALNAAGRAPSSKPAGRALKMTPGAQPVTAHSRIFVADVRQVAPPAATGPSPSATNSG